MVEEDDGAALVEQVIQENPPEGRGVRDEWAGRVGWHRKENSRLRGRRETLGALKKNQSLQDGDTTETMIPDEASSIWGHSPSRVVVVPAFFGLVLLLWRICQGRPGIPSFRKRR
jgi:hypothetical protein